MKNLGAPVECREILERVGRVQPDSPRQWGRMTAHGMLCHLSDSYLAGMGERKAKSKTGLFQRTVMKWAALRAPLRWPKGIPTMPEVEQGVGGTPPGDFAQDRANLQALVKRFSAPDFDFTPCAHPLFGAMSREQWMRWGYLHADHHLRQFSA